MACVSCGSGNQVEFPTELGIHFPGKQNIDRPLIVLFPKVIVCLDCGSMKSTVAETELRLLREGSGATP